ncbi:DUF397 domain-containing protein [Actinocorallia sp. A-T 12471]|uniref:DUF397 domain-containing protein n=1 Tax=Actinocorallia sp. A-T 12471 TaxID=3089813 RepID=UPI0029D38568|nr:DUF397 domain-containing protein [Actinocorallia sp. A-T 12471]MDX6742692.1 DUF397 domain-containing protein [Actinocorallia sp. A-T 12471]
MSTPFRWRKSSHSSPTGDACVELAEQRDRVAVRDSKNPADPHLSFTRAELRRLTTRLRA